MVALNYSRMPGFGDLSGDNTNPNSPNYIEPAFGMEDAEVNVAAQLAKDDEVGEIVSILADSRALLNWISHNVELPAARRAEFRAIDALASRMGRMAEAEFQALNGGAA